MVAQVCVEVVGYLLEELRDGKNYESFKADMADANVFIGSLIFIEELADKVGWRWTRRKGVSCGMVMRVHEGLSVPVLTG